MNNTFDDQTRFSQQGPLYQPVDETPDLVVAEIESEPLGQTPQKKIFLIGGIAVGFILIVIALAMVLTNPIPDSTQLQPSPTDSQPNQSAGPLKTRVIELEQELKIADPSQEDLPFPPVDFEISVDN